MRTEDIELVSRDSVPPVFTPQIKKTTTLKKYVVWCLVNVFGLLITEICRIKFYVTHENPDLNYHHSGGETYFQLIGGRKTSKQTVENVIKLAYLVTLIFYVANLESRIKKGGAKYLLGFVTIPVFAFLGQTKELFHFTLTRNIVTKPTLAENITLVTFLISVSVLVLYYFHLARKNKIMFQYASCLFGFIMFYTGLYCWLVSVNSYIYWHVHHWWVGYHLAVLSYFDCELSNWLFMVFYSVFLEGYQIYTLDDIIE